MSLCARRQTSVVRCSLRRPERRRGFTITEVLVAASLGALFAWAAGASIVSSSRLAQSSIERSRMTEEVRQISDLAVKYLRSARPRGACLVPLNAPVASCSRMSEVGPAVLYAAQDEMWFYGYMVGAAQAPTLQAPDCVQILFTASGEMRITRYVPTSTATYTNPAWLTSQETLRSTRASTTKPLSYFTAGGTPVPVTSPIGTRSCTVPASPDPRLSQIALVRVSAMTTSTRTGVGMVELNVTAELPSVRFRSGT